jgi:hypothetical protein
MSQLNELHTEDEADEFGQLRPSEHAYEVACEALTNAAITLMLNFRRPVPRGNASTDTEGGICLEWRRDDLDVRLVVPARKELRPYVYWQQREQRGVDRGAIVSSLSSWLAKIE